MSVIQQTVRPMRIIALPLTRAAIQSKIDSPKNVNGTSDLALTFYHFQLRSPPNVNATDEGKGKKPGRIKTFVKWASAKATDTWEGFGKAPEGNWKLMIWRRGEYLVDRMDFEELALKGIDPTLGPSLSHPDLPGNNAKKQRKEEESQIKGTKRLAIPLVYPSFAHPGATPSTRPHPSLTQLQALLANRRPLHRKGFYTWMIIAPFTAPFMVVPIIPNIPFFFCVWRSWSHYRAYRASQYLEALINQGAIVPETSEELDRIYVEHDPSKPNAAPPPKPSLPSLPPDTHTTRLRSSPANPHSSGNPEPALSSVLLSRSAIPAIVSLFSLTSHSSTDMYRAIEQARLRIAKSSPEK